MSRQDSALAELVKTAQDLLAAGDLIAARAAFEAVAQLYPERPEAHNNLGAFYLGIGEVAPAITSFARVVDLLPDQPNPRFNLGVARMRLQQHAAALVDFQAAADKDPDDPEIHNNLGVARFLTGDRAAARAAFERALALQPRFPNALLNLVDLASDAGDEDHAIGLCQDYLLQNKDREVMQRLLELLDGQVRRNLDLAIPQAEALLRSGATDEETRRHLGRLLDARLALQARA
jgi:tetratricopeptide (TPR) repeat protein